MINIKETLKGILAIGLYYLSSILLSIPFSLLIRKYNNNITIQISTISVYVLMTLIFGIIYHKELKKDFNDFKKNYKKYFKTIINYWIKGLFIMIVSSFVISIFNISSNSNQDENIRLLKEMPIVEITCACILAPLLEEIVFRLSFKNMSKNDKLFAILTGLTFAFVHIVTSLEDPRTILYIIPYGALGIAFGLLYKKTNNIFSSMTAHAIHNTLTIVELILLGALL